MQRKLLPAITVFLLCSGAVQAQDKLTEELAEARIDHENLRVYEVDDIFMGFSGVVRTAGCTDKKDERLCMDESVERVLELVWKANDVSDSERTALRVTKDLQVDDYFHIVKMVQTVNDVPVYGGSISIALNPDNNVEMVVGSLKAYKHGRKPVLDEGIEKAVDVVEAAVGGKGLLSPTQSTVFEVDGGYRRTALTDNGSLEQQVDPVTGNAVYIYRGGPKGIAVVHDGKLVEREESEVLPSNKSAHLPVRQGTNAFNWKLSSRTYDSEYVGYDYNPITGQCQYQARYDSSTADYRVNRIQDSTNSVAYKNASCSVAPYVHTGTTYTHSDYKEWDLAWRLKKFQYYTKTKIYSTLSGATKGDVGGEVGAPSWLCNGSPACYIYWENKLAFVGTGGGNTDPQGYAESGIGHEYGHHVHMSYGFEDYAGCDAYNHRKLIMQWMATVIGNAYAVEYHKHAPGSFDAYDVSDRLIYTHRDSSFPYLAQSVSCSSDSQRLTEPFWEIMHDVDCSVSTCDATTAWQTADDIGYSDSYLRELVIESMAFASLLAPPMGSNYHFLTATGSAKTYMLAKLNSTGDAAVTSILDHHSMF